MIEKCERQRDMLKESSKELIDLQSQHADFEERLISTEQLLIQAKASWAQSELEKEQLYS